MPDSKKRIKLNWMGNFRFVAENDRGLKINFDAPTKHGGEDTAPTPMETLLACFAGCTSYDVISILRKKRQSISGYSVEVEGERQSEPPEVYTNISIKYIVRGKDVRKDAVERAIELSIGKYCSVGAMIKKTADIITSFKIVNE